jgi:hypothetical protein
VYRSSYKNAVRLARTENNMAYRSSDHERWQQLDFVVGVEIRLSNNHPVSDICDELKGKYPKDFTFTGWHPQCRCHAVSILKTPEELAQENEAIMAGEAPDKHSANEVRDVPEGFKQWVAANSDRIAAAEQRGTLPYFLKDNLHLGGSKERILDSKTVNITPSPRGHFIDDIAKKDIFKNLSALGDKANHEEAYVVLNDGKVYHKKGNPNELGVSMVGENLADWANAELYHNHPLQTLSEEDIHMAVNRGLHAIHAVTSNKIFSAVVKDTNLPKMSIDDFRTLFGNVLNEYGKTLNSKEYDHFRANMQREGMKIFCEKFKIVYTEHSITF